MLKTFDISPTQPRRAKTRRSAGKAARESKPEAYLRGYVEHFDEPRTTLADVFSILLEHTLDGTAGCRIQFSRNSSGLVGQPTGPYRILHRLSHGNGILSPGNGGVHEYRIRP